MKQRIWQVLQLLAIAPVAIASALGALMGLMAFGTAFSTGHFWSTVLFALMLMAPAMMVLSLCVAILVPPEKLLARDKLAGAVALGMVSGCILAIVILQGEIRESSPDWAATLMYSAPLVLAIVHIARIAKSKRTPMERGSAMASPPLE